MEQIPHARAISMADGSMLRADHAGSREMHHRLANSLLLTSAMLRDESRGAVDPASARAALAAGAARLVAMARLHRQLSRLRPEAEVELIPFLTPICEDIQESVGLAILLHACNAQVPVGVATQIAIMLSELATNTAKHGHGTGLTVAVEIVRGAGGGLRILVEDDGPGLPDGFDPARGTGLGMQIIRSALDELHGTIRTLPSDGAAFAIDLPGAEPEAMPAA